MFKDRDQDLEVNENVPEINLAKENQPPIYGGGDQGIDVNKNVTQVYPMSGNSLQINGGRDAGFASTIAGTASFPFNEGNHSTSDIDDISDKLDCFELAQKEQRYTNICFVGQLKLSYKTCVSIHGSRVECRRPCIDVSEVYTQDTDGDTLLHTVLILLDTDTALYIINNSPSCTWLNIRNNLSQTPLHVAVLTNQTTAVRRLVVGGADVEARDRHGNLAIHLACREGFLGVLRVLLQPITKEEEQWNNYDVSLQNFNHTLGAVNYEGLTCLHLAASYNRVDVIKLLLENGADINVKAEKSGRTILHEIAWSGNLDLVKFLFMCGRTLDINAKSYDDSTAFDLARSRGNWSIVIELARASTVSVEEDSMLTDETPDNSGV